MGLFTGTRIIDPKKRPQGFGYTPTAPAPTQPVATPRNDHGDIETGPLPVEPGTGGQGITIPDDAYPQSGSSSKSKSWSYTGPAPWALDTYKQLLGFAPGMAEKWPSAWSDLEKVPGILEEQKQLIPERTLANMGDYEDWRRPIKNAYAARGMLDSTPAAAARSDLDKALFRQFSTDNLNAGLEIDKMLADHYSTKAALAGQAVDQATNLAGLGRISRSESIGDSSSFSRNPLERYRVLFSALGL